MAGSRITDMRDLTELDPTFEMPSAIRKWRDFLGNVVRVATATPDLAFLSRFHDRCRTTLALALGPRIDFVAGHRKADAFKADASTRDRERYDPILARAADRLRPALARIDEHVFAKRFDRAVFVGLRSSIGSARRF